MTNTEKVLDLIGAALRKAVSIGKSVATRIKL